MHNNIVMIELCMHSLHIYASNKICGSFTGKCTCIWVSSFTCMNAAYSSAYKLLYVYIAMYTGIYAVYKCVHVFSILCTQTAHGTCLFLFPFFPAFSSTNTQNLVSCHICGRNFNPDALVNTSTNVYMTYMYLSL